jgi:putative addiction module component (TIGR02574 family)
MPLTMPTLTPDQITRLSPPERLTLIGDLWDSMDDADVPLSADQRSELERRLASFDDDRTHGVEWEKFKAELASRAP